LSTVDELFTVVLTVGHSGSCGKSVLMQVEKRRIVVVGAGSGIGAAVAAHFHDNGDHVLAVDLRPNDTPAAAHARCDLRDPQSIAGLLDDVGADWDVLAHVAGFRAPRRPTTC